MLTDCSEDELHTLAAGEHTDQRKLLADLREKHEESVVMALEHFLCVAFEGVPAEPDA